MTEILTESFCERCGTRYTFESERPRVRLKSVKVLSRGLKNFVLSDDTSIDEAMAAARSETDREATSHQLDAFHKTFNFCLSCRQYTCPNCWNGAEARCLSCAPLGSTQPIAEIVGLGALRAPGLIGSAAASAAPEAADEEPAAWPGLGHVVPVTWSVESPAETSTVVDEPVAGEPVAPVAAESAVEPLGPVEAEPAVAAESAVEPTDQVTVLSPGFLGRFRPGENLDAELEAFEREREAESAEAAAPAEIETSPTAPAESPTPDLAAAPAPTVQTALEPEAQPSAAATGTDVIEQPTWLTTRPATRVTRRTTPTDGERTVPLQATSTPADGPGAEPEWPARTPWPGSPTPAGLPYLGRVVTPQGGIEALWAASNQELAAAPAAPGRPNNGIRPCVSCGLSLSATARFCRRCGALQGG